jgi:heptosyltransferase I
VRIALIKTSSMGDVVHAMPVVTDILQAHPEACIDWVVEEAFADLPRLHPGVTEVIPVAIRRWRRALLAEPTRAQVRAVRRRLGAVHYDLALDLQGLLKSAWLCRMIQAPSAGFSWRCAREPLAALVYDRRYAVDMSAHAIERLRSLAAQALGYRVQGLPRFGLRLPEGSLPWVPATPYAVLLHATSRAEKQWRVADWHVLIGRLREAGIVCVLPWGNEVERDAARNLARADPQAIVAPRLTLAQCALMLGHARCVVGVDTGLTHLSAALDTPTVALFAATPVWRFGPYWTPRAVGLGQGAVWPSPSDVMQAIEQLGGLAWRPEPARTPS